MITPIIPQSLPPNAVPSPQWKAYINIHIYIYVKIYNGMRIMDFSVTPLLVEFLGYLG
jgi:hypothetical protein